MANLATVTIQFKSQGSQQVANDTNQLLSLMKQLGAQFGIATTLADLTANAIMGIGKAFVDLTKSAVDSYKAFETNISALAIYNTTIQSTAAQLQRLRAIALQPGLSLDQVLKGVTYLEAAGFSAQIAERAIRVFGNALALAGKGSEDLAGVQLALGQIKSKGIISAEEINQIAERIPQVRRAMVAAFGTGNAEAIQKQGKTATEFITKIMDELDSKKGKLPVAAQTITSFMKNATDAFKYAAIIIGRGFADILNQNEGLKLAGTFFNNLKELAIEFSSVLSGIAKTEAFKELQKNLKDSLVIFHSLIPGMARSFAIGMSFVLAYTNQLLKAGNVIYNFFGQLFHEPIKLWEKELRGFMQFLNFAFIEPFQLLFNSIDLAFSKLKKFSSAPGTEANREASARVVVLEKQRAFLEKRFDDTLAGKRTGQTGSPLFKMLAGVADAAQGMLPAILPMNGDNDIVNKAFNIYDDIMKNKGFLSVLPPGLQAGKVGPSEDTKAAADDDKNKKEKQLKALQEIANNTKKANELTLRDLTYGGGQLAAQGLSRVEQSSARQVSSPQLNASNDIVRGVEKMIRMYSNSNNLNFSFRRS
jgi:tape measure domain-containing protein